MLEKITVEMTAEKAAAFEKFQQAEAKKEAERKRKEDLATYNQIVDENIAASMPQLIDVSNKIAAVKSKVIASFRQALELKGELLKVKDGQRSHTFTNTEGTMRITLGYYQRDDYRDTVEEGIAIVQEAIESYATDDNSRAMVKAVMKLLSRDSKGTLKASRVLQLQQIADESGNERFQDGVRIIRESYQPAVSKQFIRAEVKGENGEWTPVSLGMTEA